MPFLDGASVNEATSALDKLKVTYEVAGDGEKDRFDFARRGRKTHVPLGGSSSHGITRKKTNGYMYYDG